MHSRPSGDHDARSRHRFHRPHPLTKSHRGEFNITPGPTLAAFAVKAAVERAGIDPAQIEDAILGCGNPEGTTGRNIGRQTVVRAGLPLSSPAPPSPLLRLGPASHRHGGGPHRGRGRDAMIAGGVESISRIRAAHRQRPSDMDPGWSSTSPSCTWP
jgi:acetyl-CoA C-acetyltransferase/acetyl-CoA acyltransferase